MTKAAKNTPMWKAIKQINIEGLAEFLEGLGADASNILRPRVERQKRMGPPSEPICIPSAFADNIVAILRALPKQGRGPKRIWSKEIDALALMGLSSGKDISVLARQIAPKTGQTEAAVRRQLQRIERSPQFKWMQENSRKPGRTTVRLEQYTEAELEELAKLPPTAWIKPT